MSDPKGYNPEIFDGEEMMRFGLDPAISADVEEWQRTQPGESDPTDHDYSNDPFEFGSLPVCTKK